MVDNFLKLFSKLDLSRFRKYFRSRVRSSARRSRHFIRKNIFRFQNTKKQFARIFRLIRSRFTSPAQDWLLEGKGSKKIGKSNNLTLQASKGPASFSSRNRPELIELQRRAVFSLFRWLELPIVPGQFWIILETHPGPGDAVELYVRAVGCDLEKVRNRDAKELEKLLNITLALASLDISVRDKYPEITKRAESALRRGDYIELKQIGDCVADVVLAIDLAKNASAVFSCPTLKIFVTNLEAELEHFAKSDLSGLTGWADKAESYGVSARRLSTGIPKGEKFLSELTSMWPPEWDKGAERDILDEANNIFEGANDDLEKQDYLGPTDFSELADEIDEAVSMFEDLLGKIKTKKKAKGSGRKSGKSKKKKTGSHGSSTSSTKSDRERYLKVLGFKSNENPNFSAIKKRRIKMLFKYHPDRNAENKKMENTKKTQEINSAWEYLKRTA